MNLRRDEAMVSDPSALAEAIAKLTAPGAPVDCDTARAVFERLRTALSSGTVRAAEPDPASPIGWRVNPWVKLGILLGFRCGRAVAVPGYGSVSFVDKDTLPLKRLSPDAGVRLVPGGSAVRDGAFLGRGVICMPPTYINIGAYVDEDSLIDSHALVGSCAQIGRRVHVSAGAQIGGVLEPVGAFPVIIEDDVFIGGNCGLYEGVIVRRGAILAAGTILTGSTPVYDLVRGEILRGEEGPLIIPERAVVVPGARAVTREPGRSWGLSLLTPVIVKYRDAATDRHVQLEAWLR